MLNAEWVVNIDSDGSVLNSGGNLYAAPLPDLPLPAQSSAMSAVRVAVRGKLCGEFSPIRQCATRCQNQRRAIHGRPSTGRNRWRTGLVCAARPTASRLVVLHRGRRRINSYATVVDDGSQSILSKLPMTFFQSPPKGLVFGARKPPIESNARRPAYWTAAHRGAKHAIVDWRSPMPLREVG